MRQCTLYRYVLLLCLLLAGVNALADDLLRYAIPFIQHFTKRDYKAGNQNWSMTQDEDGLLYVGNSNGLLQFDGLRWNRYNLPSGTIVRSVLAHQGRVYSGSLGELGYWEKDQHFQMHYTSLTNLLPDYDFGDQEIWWIRAWAGNVVFQSFSNTFLYNGRDISILLTGQGVLFPPFVLNDRLFVQVLNKGMVEIVNNKAVFIEGSELFVGKRINLMLPFSESGTVLIGTEASGFFIWKNGKFDSWQGASLDEVVKNQVNRGVKLSNDKFAIGTLLGGIYIINQSGAVLNQINKEKGLNNNTVLGLFVDRDANLWAGLDNGVDLIKVNSPIYYNTDVSGNLGSVYAAIIYQGDLYLGTNRGLFYAQLSTENPSGMGRFEIIPGSQGQVWSLVEIDGKLFCGHNTATYLIDHYRLKLLSSISGGYDIKQYPYRSDHIFQGSYNGLSVYQKSDGQWRLAHTLPGFSKLSKFIAFERENVLWVAHTHKGLYRLELNDALDEITEVREFSKQSKSYVNKLNNKLVISSDSGFLYYDDIQNHFFSLDAINKQLGDMAQNARIVGAGTDNYWIFVDGDCARVVMDENEVRQIDDDVLNDLNDYLIPGYENIYVMDSSNTMIFLDNGYAVYNRDWKENKDGRQSGILIRQLSFQSLRGDQFQVDPEDIKVPYRYNNMRLMLSFPEYSREVDLMYMLDGYDERWTRADPHDDISFQNLPYGEYTLRVRPEGSDDAKQLILAFTIHPPWFQSKTAWSLYLLVFLLFWLLVAYYNRRKIKRMKFRHELERKYIIEKEAAENEKKLIEMRNENLRSEVKLRNSRLAKSTFSLIHKNKTLSAVKNELLQMKEELGQRFPSKYYNRIVRKIDSDLTSEKDWSMFEHSFSEVHENFLKRLKEEYPDLTPADIQLCAYLKMNLQSKEIASLLNITTRGVEIRRYRLRKKLHLEHESNLVDFIMNY
ncbi:MAG: hypothetical protein HC819_16810 [Cyclobacteriaceae bacterium]|nr:hypothetical protein [Cyclobacteriaceae bacterium]